MRRRGARQSFCGCTRRWNGETVTVLQVLLFLYPSYAVPLSTLVSSGTRSLIFFFFWYLQMEEVSFLYIDEFDAFYHTDLSVAVVRKLIDINAQAIITSHNTDLLSSGLLRPDCIFKLTDNRIKSFSELTDKALREAHNLQKMYKAGAFNGQR